MKKYNCPSPSSACTRSPELTGPDRGTQGSRLRCQVPGLLTAAQPTNICCASVKTNMNNDDKVNAQLVHNCTTQLLRTAETLNPLSAVLNIPARLLQHCRSTATQLPQCSNYYCCCYFYYCYDCDYEGDYNSADHFDDDSNHDSADYDDDDDHYNINDDDDDDEHEDADDDGDDDHHHHHRDHDYD